MREFVYIQSIYQRYQPNLPKLCTTKKKDMLYVILFMQKVMVVMAGTSFIIGLLDQLILD